MLPADKICFGKWYDEMEVSASVLNSTMPDVWLQAHLLKLAPALTSSGPFDFGQDISYPGSLEGDMAMGCHLPIDAEDTEFDQVRDIYVICGPT